MRLPADLFQVAQKAASQRLFAVGLRRACQVLLHPIEPHQLAPQFDQGLAAGVGDVLFILCRIEVLLGLHRHAPNVIDLALHGVDAQAV